MHAALEPAPLPASASATAAAPEPEPAGAGAADEAMAAAVAAAAAAVALPWVDPASAWSELSAPAAETSRDAPPGVLILPEHFERAVRCTRASTTPAERARRQAADEAFAGGVVAAGYEAKRVTLA